MSLGIVEESPIKNDLLGHNKRSNLANLFANDCSRIEKEPNQYNYAQEPGMLNSRVNNMRMNSDRKPPADVNFSNELGPGLGMRSIQQPQIIHQG